MGLRSFHRPKRRTTSLPTGSKRRPTRRALFEGYGEYVSKELITPTMRIQIELAIANARNDLNALRSLEIEAKHLALSGAEIDAAKRGGSFDLLADITVKLALAIEAGDEEVSTVARRQLTVFGIPEVASELLAFVKGLEPPPPK